ncbi:MAG: hypothetical protein HFI64_12845 [Lachnospiraceae bacterium]|nr:hypothetical protein [Lachnospiraceae bacterium]
MIEALGIPGTATVEAYRAYLFSEWKKDDFLKHGYEPMEYLITQVLSHSELLLREEDWQAHVDWELGRVACIAKAEGMILEQMTERAQAVSMTPEAYGEACCPYECFEGFMYQNYFHQKAEEYVKQMIYTEE